MFQHVRTKKFQTTRCFFVIKTFIRTLEQGEDIFNDNSLQINFLFVIKILCLQLDLERYLKRVEIISNELRTHSGHIDIGVWRLGKKNARNEKEEKLTSCFLFFVSKVLVLPLLLFGLSRGGNWRVARWARFLFDV